MDTKGIILKKIIIYVDIGSVFYQQKRRYNLSIYGKCDKLHHFRPLQPPILQPETLNTNYRYQEYEPSECLTPYIACYWTVEFKASNINKLHHIIPDGCVDIIFDLNSLSTIQGAFVTELMTRFEVINLFHDCSLFGIRFYLTTASHFFQYPIAEFSGHQVFLEHIWGHEAVFLQEDISSARSMSEIIAKLEAKLITFLPFKEQKSDPLLQTSIHYMLAHQGIISIKSLSEKLSYSERHIRRTFQKEVGINPKELLNIIRFQFLLKKLNASPQAVFTDVALKSGFYDQPHFIKDFKRFYGNTPSDIFRLNNKNHLDH